jgi:hypothetical protein
MIKLRLTPSRHQWHWWLLPMALALLKAGPSQAAGTGVGYYVRGQAAFRAHHYGVAARDYEQAISHAYRSAGAYYQLGLCYTHLRRWNVALWAYDTAALLDPAFAAGHPNLLHQQRLARAQGGKDVGPPPALAYVPIILPSSVASPPVARADAGQPGGRDGGSTVWWLVAPLMIVVALCAPAIVVRARRIRRGAAPTATPVALPPRTSTVPDTAPPAGVVLPDMPPTIVPASMPILDGAAPITEVSISTHGSMPAAAAQGGTVHIDEAAGYSNADAVRQHAATALARQGSVLFRCPKLLPRRPAVTLLDEIQYARAVLRDRPSASQFIQRMLLWPSIAVPSHAFIEEYGKEALRVYYLIGLVDRIRRTNVKRVQDMLPLGLDDEGLSVYCGACLRQRLRGMARTFGLLADGTPVTAEGLAAAMPADGPGVQWNIEEAQRRLKLLQDLHLVAARGSAYQATPLLATVERLAEETADASVLATTPRSPHIPALAASRGQLLLPASDLHAGGSHTLAAIPIRFAPGNPDSPALSPIKSLEEAIAALDLLEDLT